MLCIATTPLLGLVSFCAQIFRAASALPDASACRAGSGVGPAGSHGQNQKNSSMRRFSGSLSLWVASRI